MTLTEFLVEARKNETAWVVAVYRDTLILGKRSDHVNNPGQWNFFGGHLDSGESAREAAAREFREETGFDVPPGSLKKLDVINGASYFICYVSDAAKLRRSKETAKIRAFKKNELPDELHSKTKAFLDKNGFPA